MKKISWLIIPVLLVITGCFDTVDETTINENGSGIYVHKDDMGKMFSLLSAFAGDTKMKELDEMKQDTTIYIKDIRDSLKDLSLAEKKIIEGGALKVDVDSKKELLLFTFSFPFSKPGDIGEISSVLKKTKSQLMSGAAKKKLAEKDTAQKKGLFDKEIKNEDLEGLNSSVNDYYITDFRKGKLSRKVNKEKLEKLENDKGMTTLKEMSSMGMNPNMKTIINLPKPAKKAEGKGVTLSADKKTVTIENSVDDFFEDASSLEYEIEY